MGRVRGKHREDSSDVPVFQEETQASAEAGCRLENVLTHRLTDMCDLTLLRKCDQRFVRHKDGTVVGVRLLVWEAIPKSRDMPAS